MSVRVSIREANQQFSRLVREVEAGGSFVITRDGVPVARLAPCDLPGRSAAELAEAKARMERFLTESAFDFEKPIVTWTRDDLHER